MAVRTSTQPRRRRQFVFEVRSERLPAEKLDLTGVEMNMGLFSDALKGGSQTRSATVSLPLCTLKKMHWRAEVVLPDRVAVFRFVSARY